MEIIMEDILKLNLYAVDEIKMSFSIENVIQMDCSISLSL